MVLMVDVPSGWRYGFPMPLPAGKKLIDLLKENNYPEGDIEFALNYSRWWEDEEKTDE